MSFKNLSATAALGIATNIKHATCDRDRTKMAMLHYKYNGLGRITKLLVVTGFMTPKQRFAALAMMPRIRNASSKIKI